MRNFLRIAVAAVVTLTLSLAFPACKTTDKHDDNDHPKKERSDHPKHD